MPESPRHSPNDESTSASLIRRIQSQDQDAWSPFVDRYGPLIARWCRKYSLRDDDVADVFQSVLLGVSTGIGGFDYRDPGSKFRKWLWAITRNKLYDHFRNREPAGKGGTAFQQLLNQVPEREPDIHSDANGYSVFGSLGSEIAAVRATVAEHAWQAFWEAAIEGRQPIHVAEDLDMTVGAVYAAKCRILKKIRAIYAANSQSEEKK